MAKAYISRLYLCIQYGQDTAFSSLGTFMCLESDFSFMNIKIRKVPCA